MQDLLRLALLAGFVLLSVLLLAAGGTRLHRLWWAGSLVSGLVTGAMAASLDGTLLEIPVIGESISAGTVPGIVLSAVVGFLAGTDVQVLIGLVIRRATRVGAILGAVLGPTAVVGALYLLDALV